MISKKIYVKIDNSAQYLQIAQELYSKAIDSKIAHLYSAPFVLFCATALEYLLNNIVINYANTHFEGNTQKQYAESFITLGVSAKLLTFLPIVSGNKYQLNLNSFEYKTLKQIITKRNKIAHGKDFYKDAEPSSSEDSSFSIDLERLERDHFLFLNKNECDRYFKALHSFVENVYNILERDKLNGTDLIIPIIKKRSK